MLTDTQLQTLAAHVRANTDPAVVSALAGRNDTELARLYNLAASPSYPVWLKALSKVSLRKAALAGAAEMDNLEAGKRDALFWLLADEISPEEDSTRQALLDLTANRTGGFIATALRTALTAAAKRDATVFEKVYATAPSNGVAKLDVEGPISVNDMSTALNRF